MFDYYSFICFFKFQVNLSWFSLLFFSTADNIRKLITVSFVYEIRNNEYNKATAWPTDVLVVTFVTHNDDNFLIFIEKKYQYECLIFTVSFVYEIRNN